MGGIREDGAAAIPVRSMRISASSGPHAVGQLADAPGDTVNPMQCIHQLTTARR